MVRDERLDVAPECAGTARHVEKHIVNAGIGEPERREQVMTHAIAKKLARRVTRILNPAQANPRGIRGNGVSSQRQKWSHDIRISQKPDEPPGTTAAHGTHQYGLHLVIFRMSGGDSRPEPFGAIPKKSPTGNAPGGFATLRHCNSRRQLADKYRNPTVGRHGAYVLRCDRSRSTSPVVERGHPSNAAARHVIHGTQQYHGIEPARHSEQ